MLWHLEGTDISFSNAQHFFQSSSRHLSVHMWRRGKGGLIFILLDFAELGVYTKSLGMYWDSFLGWGVDYKTGPGQRKANPFKNSLLFYLANCSEFPFLLSFKIGCCSFRIFSFFHQTGLGRKEKLNGLLIIKGEGEQNERLCIIWAISTQGLRNWTGEKCTKALPAQVLLAQAPGLRIDLRNKT